MWLELSAVTIPANADASIATIKSCDRAAVKKTVRLELKDPTHYPPMKISTPPRAEPIEHALRRAARRGIEKSLEQNLAIHEEIAANRRK
jgi:hypothetical protein